jgi:mannose-1-phosphate guanylyltransferase/mannose-6-phosphate isomerase
VSLVAHVLCGGSGTRLWPISREEFPKQFAPVLQGKSLLAATLQRAALLSNQIVCISNEKYRLLIDLAIEEAALSPEHIVKQILEPVARNTAAAIASAALLAQPDDLLLFLSADHYIPDAEGFAQTVSEGISAASDGHIVTFGIQPNFPSVAYGYIEQGNALETCGGFIVKRFIEKPNLERAEQFLAEKTYFWNAGIFLASAQTLLSAFEEFAPDILHSCTLAAQQSRSFYGHTHLDHESFFACRSESIDFAIMEKHEKIAVIPYAGVWSDVGSWNSLALLQAPDLDGNRFEGWVHAFDCKNTVLRSSSSMGRPTRPVVLLGLDDVVVVDTDDALLVSKSSHVDQVKFGVQKLKAQNAIQISQHAHVARHWGCYDNVDEDVNHRVRRIHLLPGKELHTQVHHYRAEHWIVVKGTATVRRGQELFSLAPNQSTYIPSGVEHQLLNKSTELLELIEVQTGSELSEFDVVRTN